VDDLFATDQEECIDLPDADIRLFRSALPQQAADNCYSRIFDETDWQERDIFIWGKRRKQPRLIAWYGDKGASYAYSGNRFEPSPWTPLLKKLRQKVEALSQSSFNSVLLNLYRDSNDNMGWHSDNEAELGPKPTIASLSLGATREFQLKHVNRPDIGIVKIALTHGSLLVMSGTTQQYWLHAIKREKNHVSPRINLTFRYVQAD
jgi:alkylated DNA repair dioxygenase AlkB